MARRDALLRIRGVLLERRAELANMVADELGGLRHDIGDGAGGDDGDVAAESINNEMTSQLAQLESREIDQIDRALERIHEGSYGACEICEAKIPVARLNALPYTTVCIDCQRRMETNPRLREESLASWARLPEREAVQ